MSTTERTTAGMSSERVFQPGTADEDREHLRMWVWLAIKRVGGSITVNSDEFYGLVNSSDATLHWKIDPCSLALTIVAE